jgi:hypothetical protein
METYLSSDVTVKQYLELEKEQDQDAIADFVFIRFSERYIEPMRIDPNKKNGFTIMAVSCLMIEALESFKQGLPNTKRKSQLTFCNFLDQNSDFHFLKGFSQEFYSHVRCGILHQAETTGGWHIRRDGSVFRKNTKTINAKLFHDRVEKVLKAYCSALREASWDDRIWVNFRKKMKAVIKTCEK